MVVLTSQNLGLLFTISPVQCIHHPQNAIKGSLNAHMPCCGSGTGTKSQSKTQKPQSGMEETVSLELHRLLRGLVPNPCF